MINIEKFKRKDLISIEDMSKEELETILNVSEMIKAKQRNRELFVPLLGKSLAMIFRKPSTRTRVSFEMAMFQLGGAAMYLSPGEIQMGRSESVADTAKVLSRFVNGIMIRTFAHDEVKELAANASIPVINGLTDFSHPCQIIADLFTLKEKKKALSGLTVAYVGDGNNVCNSWLFAAPKMDINLRVASPKGFEPDSAVVEKSKAFAAVSKTKVIITNSAEEAVEGADVVYTDVWASMGQEEQAEERKKVFVPYQINAGLIKKAKPDCLVMHCLPAHRGDEITDEVMDGAHSVVFDQAENRLHAQKGILALLMGR